MTKRRKLKKAKTLKHILLWAVIVIAAIHLISAATLDRVVEYKKVPFRSASVPSDLDGYTIAFFTDTHSMPVQKLEEVVSKVSEMQPDILVLGGDYSANRETMERSMEVFSNAGAADGVYGVCGNHDNQASVSAAMESHSIHPLLNSGIRIKEHFYIAGTEDLWAGCPDVGKALERGHPGDFVLLAAHNPDTVMAQDASAADLVLSGHTHGGQITFFGLWAPALSGLNDITLYGQRFMSGWAEAKDGAPVYVSNGAGTFPHVPRIFARPQVILITLQTDTKTP